MLNCRYIERILSAYADGELSGVEMLKIRDHLSYCENCSKEHASLVNMKRALNAMPVHIPNPAFESKLLTQIAEGASLPQATFLQRLIRDLSEAVKLPSGRNKWILASTGALSLAGWLFINNVPDTSTAGPTTAGITGYSLPAHTINSATEPNLPFRPGIYIRDVDLPVQEFQRDRENKKANNFSGSWNGTAYPAPTYTNYNTPSYNAGRP